MQRIIFIIAFLALTTLAGSKAFALDEAGFCALVTAETASENKDAPYEIDAVTKGAGATFDCAAKTFESKRAISLKQSDLDAGWQDKLSAGWSQTFCADADWHAGVAAGWVVNGHYTFADGSEFVVTVKCP
jgi:hypothetical protein